MIKQQLSHVLLPLRKLQTRNDRSARRRGEGPTGSGSRSGRRAARGCRSTAGTAALRALAASSVRRAACGSTARTGNGRAPRTRSKTPPAWTPHPTAENNGIRTPNDQRHRFAVTYRSEQDVDEVQREGSRPQRLLQSLPGKALKKGTGHGQPPRKLTLKSCYGRFDALATTHAHLVRRLTEQGDAHQRVKDGERCRRQLGAHRMKRT